MHSRSVCLNNAYQTGNNMTRKKKHDRHCLLYEYEKVFNPPVAYCSICKVENAMDNSNQTRWFRKLQHRDESCKNYSYYGCILMYYDEDLGTVIVNFPHPTAEKSDEMFSEYRTTVESSKHVICFITKFDQWVPHQLTLSQCEESISTCSFFLSCNNK